MTFEKFPHGWHKVPCPFCKGEFVQIRETRNTNRISGAVSSKYRVACLTRGCTATGPAKDSEVEAINAWLEVARAHS